MRTLWTRFRQVSVTARRRLRRSDCRDESSLPQGPENENSAFVGTTSSVSNLLQYFQTMSMSAFSKLEFKRIKLFLRVTAPPPPAATHASSYW